MHIQKPAEQYDVAVIGAGMVGASFALALRDYLADHESSMLVVEASSVTTGQISSPSFDDRSTALSFGSCRVLQRIGVWEQLAGHLAPIKEIHVSDRGHFGSTRLDCRSEGVPALGYVVENQRFGQVLNESLLAERRIDLVAPVRVTDIRPGSGGMQLQLSDGSEEAYPVNAGLVVLADGGRSPICSRLGITTDRQRYGQQAIIGNVAFEKSHDHVAYERFTDSGPLAILPLATLDGEHRGALVWTIRDDNAERLMGMSEPGLLAELQERFGYRLGRFTRIGKRGCYPLSLQVAREQVRPGLVLLGNVAHTLHPVAGQGFNLALRDVEQLASVLGEALESGRSPGEMKVLQAFLQRQQQDQSRTIGFSHYLTRMFSSSRRGLVWARKFGLASIDIVPAVRHGFARTAMGLADR